MPVSPISLYIDLEPETTAEIEVVARASLEFAAGIREVAFLIDPSFEFRIELERGDEGSLWLKAVIRWVRGIGYAHPTMVAVTAAAMSWFAAQTSAYTYEHLLDYLLESKDPEIVKLAPEQIQEIAHRAVKVIESHEAGEHFRGVYRELAKDTAVRGVGVAPQHDRPPAVIVPRGEFERRASGTIPIVIEGVTRVKVERGDFVIIKPVLKHGGGRWRLRGPIGEFSASIADENFYNDILRGAAPVPLAAEIHISADLETTEEQTVEGAWRPIKHRVTKVYGIERQPEQQPLFPSGD